MQTSKNKMKMFLSNKTRAVLFFESHGCADIEVLKLLKDLSASKNNTLKHLIVVCHLHFTHTRLKNPLDLQVLFSIKKSKILPNIQQTEKKKDKIEFALEKICIQKKPSFQFNSFEQFHNEFLENAENKIVFTLSEPFQLIPISIPKPWGQEIWYSGIEARGVANIQTLGMVPTVHPLAELRDNGQLRDDIHSIPPRGLTTGLTTGTIPLSWIVAAVPTLLFGKKFAHKDPILIKILDPFPEDVIGDLYYELHIEKNEVYVVTDIAAGCGKIKIGINSQKLRSYDGNKQKFKNHFLKSILEYEKIRRQIDSLNDLQQKIPHYLQESEIELRKSMNHFCGFVDLNIGDVINVPTFVPHALQHGVKVIEFQTPTYERLIISFAQKVLTQSHWDTKRAFDVIQLKSFQKQKLKILSKNKNILKELVCEFPDFKVSRWTVSAHAKCEIARKPNYRILFVVSGNILTSAKSLTRTKIKKNETLLSGMCVLIPQNTHIHLLAKEKSVFLICVPKLL